MTNETKQENVQEEVQKENPFDKAEKEVLNTAEVEDDSNGTPTAPKVDVGEEEINVDTLDDTEWIKTPKEIGTSTPLIKIVKFSKKPGRTISPKGMASFWSGLTRKDKATGVIENCEEYNIKGTVKGEKVSYKVDSWEQVGKIMTLLRYCKRTNIMFVGQTVKFNRVAKGTSTAGHNFILEVPSLKMKIEGDSNEIKTEA